MSDRLPSRRRRSGGRHVAPRRRPALPRALDAKRLPTRAAQGGIALGLVLGMGGVVAAAEADEPGPTSVLTAEAPARDAAQDRTVELRAQAVVAARAAVAEVERVRADAEQVAVPQDVLAELDAATRELQEAIDRVDVPPAVERRASVSRSGERSTTPDTATATPDAATPDAATPDPVDPAADPTAPPADPTVQPDPAPAPAATSVPDGSTETPPTDAPAAGTTPAAGILDDVTLPDVPDPQTTPLREALDRVRVAAERVLTTAEQKKAEAAAQAAADEAARVAAEEAQRVAAEQAAQRAAWKASLRGFANGQVPSSALCGVAFDPRAQLRCDAAEALEALNAAYTARFGRSLEVSDSYRSYNAQVACRANKGSLCAVPGTSNHGMGVAVDLGGGIQTFGTAQHRWMRENAGTWSWTLPEWARAGGSKPEPWHWEYTG